MIIPPALILVNGDLNDTLKNTLATQLSIDEIISDTEFDARISADGYYPIITRLYNKRILIIRSQIQTIEDGYTAFFFQQAKNRNEVDVVIFVKNGLASILYNKFGPPNLTFPVQKLYIQQLLNNLYQNACGCGCQKNCGCSCVNEADMWSLRSVPEYNCLNTFGCNRSGVFGCDRPNNCRPYVCNKS
jgi:hypothetical protein